MEKLEFLASAQSTRQTKPENLSPLPKRGNFNLFLNWISPQTWNHYWFSWNCQSFVLFLNDETRNYCDWRKAWKTWYSSMFNLQSFLLKHHKFQPFCNSKIYNKSFSLHSSPLILCLKDARVWAQKSEPIWWRLLKTLLILFFSSEAQLNV